MKPRTSLIDWGLTKDARFVDKGSLVLLDGREILQGEDWSRRKDELLERSKGQCEYMIPSPGGFERCRRRAEDPHHIIPRGSNGVDRDDRLLNLKALCRRHHDLQDRRKPQWQAKSPESE